MNVSSAIFFYFCSSFNWHVNIKFYSELMMCYTIQNFFCTPYTLLPILYTKMSVDL